MAAFKRRMNKAVKDAKETARYYVAHYLYSSIYLLGLTALIPAVVINAAPTELGFWSGTPLIISFLAVLLVVFSVWRIMRLHKNHEAAFKALGWTTFFPGILSIAVSMGITGMVSNIVYSILPDLVEIQAIIDLYLRQVVPHVWFLTLGYISVGAVWYLMAKVRE